MSILEADLSFSTFFLELNVQKATDAPKLPESFFEIPLQGTSGSAFITFQDQKQSIMASCLEGAHLTDCHLRVVILANNNCRYHEALNMRYTADDEESSFHLQLLRSKRLNKKDFPRSTL